MKKNFIFLVLLIMIIVPSVAVNASENKSALSKPSECSAYTYGLKFDSNELSNPNTKTSEGNTIKINNFKNKDGEDAEANEEFVQFSWTSSTGVDYVEVKAGTDGDTSSTYNKATSGTETTGGSPQKGVSHISFCWNAPQDDPDPTSVTFALSCEWDSETEKSVNTVAITQSEGVINLEYKIDNGTWTAYNGPIPISGSGTLYAKWDGDEGYNGGDDDYEFEAEDCSPKDDTDDTSVTFALLCEWDSETQTSVNTVAITESEGVINLQYKIDNGSWNAYNAPIPISGSGTLYAKWDGDEGYNGGDDDYEFEAEDCSPKEEEEEEKPVDPKPDVAAGGSGPSLIFFMAPATIGITSLGLAWTAIKKKWMNR